MLISGQPISSSPISAEGVFFIEGSLEVFLFSLKINTVSMFKLEISY